MKEREILLTNERGLVPAEGQQFSINAQLTPRPSNALIAAVRDNLGSRVPSPPPDVIAVSTGPMAAEPASELTSNVPTSNEPPQQYETTAEQ